MNFERKNILLYLILCQITKVQLSGFRILTPQLRYSKKTRWLKEKDNMINLSFLIRC